MKRSVCTGRPESGDISSLLESNTQWANAKGADPSFFEQLDAGQIPHSLYIGCCDARVNPYAMLGCDYGDLFVHRNVGNLFSEGDVSSSAALEFAVNVIQVRNIIVCGHYRCGAVAASCECRTLSNPSLDLWVDNLRAVRESHQATLSAISSEEGRLRALSELNAVAQARNVLAAPCVIARRRATAGEGSFPKVHCIVFDPANGLVTPLMQEGLSLSHVSKTPHKSLRTMLHVEL